MSDDLRAAVVDLQKAVLDVQRRLLDLSARLDASEPVPTFEAWREARRQEDAPPPPKRGKPDRRGRPLTADEQRQIIEADARGESTADVAERLGINRQTVQRVAKRGGVKPGRPGKDGPPLEVVMDRQRERIAGNDGLGRLGRMGKAML